MNEFEKDNVIKNKSYRFALRAVKLYKYLTENKKEFVLSKQLLRSGTSIGANVEEAIGGISKKDFLNKIYIVYKESRETRYWINLLKDADYITDKEAKSIMFDCEELIKLSGKIISSSKKNIRY